jgi:hypothetical protein
MPTEGVVSAVILTLLFSLPLPAVLLFYYPLCRANHLLSAKGCALVGEESVMEYAKQKTVIFRDSDLYAAKKCTQTMVREGEDFRRDMQLASILFSVPQISVHLDRITEEQKKALSHYISFWREHRDILLNGKLYACDPGAVYSKAYSEKDGKAVSVNYEDPTVQGEWDSLVAVNCTGKTYLYLDGFAGKSYKVVNCMGEEIGSGTLAEISKISVPRGGMIFVD